MESSQKGARPHGNGAPGRPATLVERCAAARRFVRGRTGKAAKMCPAARKLDISAHSSQLRSWKNAAAQLKEGLIGGPLGRADLARPRIRVRRRTFPGIHGRSDIYRRNWARTPGVGFGHPRIQRNSARGGGSTGNADGERAESGGVRAPGKRRRDGAKVRGSGQMPVERIGGQGCANDLWRCVGIGLGVPCFRGPRPNEETIPTTAKACLDFTGVGRRRNMLSRWFWR